MKKNIHWSAFLLCFVMVFLQGCSGVVSPSADSAEETEKIVYEETEQDQEHLAEVTERVQKETAQEGYYYSQLSEDEKVVYEQVYRSLADRKEVSVSTLSSEVLDKVFTCVLNDHPEIFYTSGYIYTAHSRGDETVSLSFVGKYDYDEAECKRREGLIQQESERILSGIPADAADFDKIKYIFDLLVNETEYVAGSEDNQNICSVLIGHESTCQGYAKATQYLLSEAGIEATLVMGRVFGGEGHAWNLVKLDGNWYFVDTTWGDASYQIVEGGAEDFKGSIPPINYDYLCVSTSQLLRTHTIDEGAAIPVCDSMEDNYYVREGRYFTELDKDKLEQLFEKAYDEEDHYITLKCETEEVYQEMLKYLIEEQGIFKYLNNGEGAVSYAENKEQMSLSFWL